jgi:hypothetical protein
MLIFSLNNPSDQYGFTFLTTPALSHHVLVKFIQFISNSVAFFLQATMNAGVE